MAVAKSSSVALGIESGRQYSAVEANRGAYTAELHPCAVAVAIVANWRTVVCLVAVPDASGNTESRLS